MIRLSPTRIPIGLGDIKDYDRRAKRRAKLQLGNNLRATPHHQHQIILPIRSIGPRSRIYAPSDDAIPSTDGSHLVNETSQQSDEDHSIHRLESPFTLERVLQRPAPAQNSNVSKWAHMSPCSSSCTITDDRSFDASSGILQPSEMLNVAREESFEEWLDARREKLANEVREIQSSQESAEIAAGEESFENVTTRRLSSPSKDNFDYGGFVESPSQQDSDQSRESSPFGKTIAYSA